MKKIYCVEDDESIRELIIYALKSVDYTAVGFERGSDFYRALKEELPSLILLDIMLPEEDGIEILKKLKADPTYQKIPVIMITAKTSEYDKVKGLDSGADDYITKPFGIMELISRIRAVLRRYEEKESPSTLVCLGDLSIDYDKREVRYKEQLCDLTYKEFELLYYLVKNKSIVLSREKILAAVWSFDFEGETRTVDMHIKTLRQKLEACGCIDLIKTIRSVGYKIEG